MNFDDRRAYEGGGTEHFHAPVYVEGAPKPDGDEDNKVIEFIDPYIGCSFTMKNKYSEFNDLVKALHHHTQTSHHHTQTSRKRKVPSVGLLHLGSNK